MSHQRAHFGDRGAANSVDRGAQAADQAPELCQRRSVWATLAVRFPVDQAAESACGGSCEPSERGHWLPVDSRPSWRRKHSWDTQELCLLRPPTHPVRG